MKKWIVLLLAMMIAGLVFWSCSDDGPTKPDEQTEVISDNTVIINTDVAAGMESGSNETGTFVFTEGTDLSKITVGSVIVSGSTDLMPDGYLRKVTIKTKAKGKIVLETEQAALTDAIEKCSFSKTISLDTVSVDSVWYAEGVKALNNKNKFGTAINVIFYDNDNNYSTTDDQIKLNGSIQINPSLVFDFDIDDWKLQRFKITLETTKEFNAVAEIGAAKDINIVELKIVTFSMSPITIPTPLFGFPVVVTPVFEIYAKADGTISANAKFGITSTETNKIGALYENSQWTEVKEHTENFSYNNIECKGEIELKAGAGAKLITKFYGVIGPYLSAEGYGKIVGSAHYDLEQLVVEYSLRTGVDAKIGLLMKIFSHVVLDTSIGGNIFETVLKVGEFIYGSPPPTPTLATPTNGSTVQDLTPTFDWSDATGATSYTILLDNNSDFSSPSINTTAATSTYTPGTNLTAGTYYWKVLATNSAGSSSYTTAWSVIVQAPITPPPTPTLATPTNGSTVQDLTPTFDWSDATGATSYTILVDNNSDFSSPSINTTAATSTYTPGTNLTAGTYYWKVLATNSAGSSSYTTAWSVIVQDAKYINITAPVAGAQWDLAMPYDITWDCNFTDAVRIVIMKGGDSLSTIDPSAYNDGVFTYTVTYTHTPGTDYQIKLVNTANWSINDTSDYFTILDTPNSPPTCEIVLGTEGTSYTQGETIQIQISAHDTDGTVDSLRCYRNDELVSSMWTVPNFYNWFTDSEDANGSYTFKVIAVDDDGAEGTSNEITVTLNDGTTPAGFVYVQGGTFTMGDHFSEGDSDELPLHSVTVSDFYMEATEVTQAEWTATMGSNPASGYGVGGTYPVYYVSWYSIIKYCNLRSMNEGLTPCYTISSSTDPAVWGTVPTSSNSTWNAAICNWSANGYRLPSEAEWEYASRGGIHNADNYHYSGSDTIDDVAWYYSNSGSTSHPVGTKAANQLGLYDMSGNLWEWCWDWYGSYTSDAQTNPTGPTTGSDRVIRGGGWGYNAPVCRVASRGYVGPYYSSVNYGFRLSRTP